MIHQDLQLRGMENARQVFESPQEYDDWAERFAEEVRPQIEANRWKQALSEHSARQHLVD